MPDFVIHADVGVAHASEPQFDGFLAALAQAFALWSGPAFVRDFGVRFLGFDVLAHGFDARVVCDTHRFFVTGRVPALSGDHRDIARQRLLCWSLENLPGAILSREM